MRPSIAKVLQNVWESIASGLGEPEQEVWREMSEGGGDEEGVEEEESTGQEGALTPPPTQEEETYQVDTFTA